MRAGDFLADKLAQYLKEAYEEEDLNGIVHRDTVIPMVDFLVTHPELTTPEFFSYHGHIGVQWRIPYVGDVEAVWDNGVVVLLFNDDFTVHYTCVSAAVNHPNRVDCNGVGNGTRYWKLSARLPNTS